MIDKNQFRICCRRLREQSPLVHCITNYVAMEFSANALLAVGASPFMSFCQEEMNDVSAISQSLLINIGCLDTVQVQAMEIAAGKAMETGKKWVFDPVGAGAGPYRDSVSHTLAFTFHPTVIRGNASEILALSGGKFISKGVDSIHSTEEALQSAKALAIETGAVVSVSGAKDIITDGKKLEKITLGNEMMPKITAMGCVASALTAAFLTVCEDDFEAAVFSMVAMGLAGDQAMEKSSGPGSLRQNFIDALYNVEQIAESRL